MPTLKDVAQLANVDVSTVSRALNNTAHVHPATKARILKAAKELGYRPNPIAQGLRRGRQHTIGIVVPRLQLTIFAEIAQGVEEEAQKLGYSIIFANSNDDPKLEAESLNRMRSGFVDAIIIAGTGKNGRLMRDIQTEGTPVVQVVRMQEQSLSSVVADYYACSYEAIHYLMEKGCREIGLINSPRSISPYKRRYDGYRDAIREHGLESICVTPSSNLEPNNFEYGYRCAARLLDEHPNLDAIAAAVDIRGLGAMRVLHERGLKCPDDIRVICLTGHAIGRMLETTMTAMEIPAIEMGQKAARMAVEAIEAQGGAAAARQHLVFSPTLVVRESA